MASLRGRSRQGLDLPGAPHLDTLTALTSFQRGRVPSAVMLPQTESLSDRTARGMAERNVTNRRPNPCIQPTRCGARLMLALAGGHYGYSERVSGRGPGRRC